MIRHVKKSLKGSFFNGVMVEFERRDRPPKNWMEWLQVSLEDSPFEAVRPV